MDVFSGMDATVQKALLFNIAGLVGMFAHYVKKWAEGAVVGDFFCYLVIDHPKRTIATLMSFFSAVGVAFATGTVDGMQPLALIGAGFTLGFTLDSAFNKGAKA